MVDGRCNTDSPVAAGIAERLHAGRGNSHPAIACPCRGAIPDHSGATTGVGGGQVAAYVTTKMRHRKEKEDGYDLCFTFSLLC